MLRLEKYLASLVALLAVMTSTEDLLNLASIGGGVKYVGPLISRALSVIGLGYVGLPTAVLFASKSLKVVGVDIDASKVEAVNSGRCYLREPGLAELLRDAVSKGFLRATTDAIRAVRVRCRDHRSPTPVKGGVAALSHLRDALESVKEACSPPWSTRFCLGPLRLAELLPEGSELRVVLL
jgi:UDP-N-acetyl-D-mannosaminuronic acid dehydrogenase